MAGRHTEESFRTGTISGDVQALGASYVASTPSGNAQPTGAASYRALEEEYRWKIVLLDRKGVSFCWEHLDEIHANLSECYAEAEAISDELIELKRMSFEFHSESEKYLWEEKYPADADEYVNADDEYVDADDASSTSDDYVIMDSPVPVTGLPVALMDLPGNNSLEVEGNSCDVEDNSFDVDDNSCDVEDNSCDVEDNSFDVEDNSFDVDDNKITPDSVITDRPLLVRLMLFIRLILSVFGSLWNETQKVGLERGLEGIARKYPNLCRWVQEAPEGVLWEASGVATAPPKDGDFDFWGDFLRGTSPCPSTAGSENNDQFSRSLVGDDLLSVIEGDDMCNDDDSGVSCSDLAQRISVMRRPVDPGGGREAFRAAQGRGPSSKLGHQPCSEAVHRGRVQERLESLRAEAPQVSPFSIHGAASGEDGQGEDDLPPSILVRRAACDSPGEALEEHPYNVDQETTPPGGGRQ